MLTVREALEMPAFDSARVVAGHDGLDNQIRWVHIVDIPDADYEWGRRGVLLLTAGFGMREDEARQAALIPTLVEKGFAGMVISIGYYFQSTPDVMLEAANDAGFPIIEVPRDVFFIDITEEIFERIVNRQYGLLQQAGHIHEKLTSLVLEGGDLTNLAETLAGLIDRSITVEDPSFNVLAASQHGPVDEARERSVSNGRTTPEVARRLLSSGIYTTLREQMEPMRVQPMPELGMEMERIVAPIIVDRDIHGYIWIISGARPLTDLDELAVDHAATVAALMMLKEEAVREAEQALRGDFLEQLLREEKDQTILEEQARQLGYRLERTHQVLMVEDSPEAGDDERPLLDAVDEWLRRHEHRALLVWRDEGLVIVIESESTGTGKDIAAGLVDAISHPVRRLLIGVGGVAAGDDVRRSYDEAREAARISAAMEWREGAFSFEELGLLHWLYNVPASVRAHNTYLQHIETLADYDVEHDSDLVNSLEAYLDAGGSLVDAANTLYIHRNTLLYRVERIEALCDVDLRNPMQQLNLHAAVKAFRLYHA